MNIVNVSVSPEPQQAGDGQPQDQTLKVRVAIPQGPGISYDTIAYLNVKQAVALMRMVEMAIEACDQPDEKGTKA